ERRVVMNRRSIPALALLVVGAGALVSAGRDAPETPAPYFSTPAGAWMPAVSEDASLTGSWFCPGVPATGEDGVGGEVVIANRDDEPLVGRFSILTVNGLEVEQPVVVEPWSRGIIDVDAYVTAPFASVVVEIDGARGFVEQRATHPAGDSVSACSTDTSGEWYFADGFTVDGSVETLILTNPYDDAAVVNLTFATESGEAQPTAFQGYTVLPQSVETIQMGQSGLGARDEAVIGVQVEAERGRLVVGRAQHYLGGGRLGYQVGLGAPALRDQFWFADGERGDGITETYPIYNPTDTDVQVDVVFLGLPLDTAFSDITVEVPAHQVVVFDPLDETLNITLPDGRHSVVFSTLSDPSIVVERVLTRPAGDLVATSVVVGAPPRSDGYVASRWHVGIGPSVPTEDALVVYNVDNVEGTVSIEAVGPSGPTPVASLTDLPIGGGAVLTIDLTDPAVLDRELIVQTTNRVFVERLLPRGNGLSGSSGSWALPSAGD
ncbi:MAG: DUF5719 family protein, partial [Ilumatobacteraceae bacterium]